MKILQVHNFYQQPGGEDQVFAAEYEMLTTRGHQVIRYEARNDELLQISGMRAAVNAHWNNSTYKTIRRMIRDERPEIVHAHNTFPMISPSLYYAAAAERVPVVQTLHNYRLICPDANLFRDGHICEDCVGSLVPYSALLHRCYRNSFGATAVTASTLAVHRFSGTWTSKVTTYIALSAFAKSRFVKGGLRDERITIKPNFLARDPGFGAGDGGYVLFAGRLCEEKGIRVLLDAWQKVGPHTPLKIAGQGALADLCKQKAARLPTIQLLGQLDRSGLLEAIKGAKLVVFPSVNHESGPMIILEAFACGTPVLASDLASLHEFVKNGDNGFYFRTGDADDLAAKLKAVFTRPELLASMRQSARDSYLQNYTAEQNYALLMDIYRRTCETKPV